MSRNEAMQQVLAWKSKKLKIVIVDAVLDIPHYRHADYFLACANLGDKLIVRIPSDKLIALKKDARGPIVHWEERAKHAAHYPYIDLIIDKSDFDGGWLADYHPDVIVRSVSSGTELIDEANKLMPIYQKLGIELIVMDQFANRINTNTLIKESMGYANDKFGTDKFSGSIIKKEIGKRAIEDYLKSNEISLPLDK